MNIYARFFIAVGIVLVISGLIPRENVPTTTKVPHKGTQEECMAYAVGMGMVAESSNEVAHVSYHAHSIYIYFKGHGEHARFITCNDGNLEVR